MLVCEVKITPDCPAALTLTNVSCGYSMPPVDVLQNIDISVAPGEHVVLLGASGCGKSTLLRVIARLMPPKAGTVQTAGPVAYVQQDPAAQIVGATVLEDVMFGLLNQGMVDTKAAMRSKHVLDEMGISHLVDRPTERLSSGELQLVALAGAVVTSPAVLLLDEPAAFLDTCGRSQLAALIRQWCLQGIAVVEATHSLRTCRQAHRVLLLSAGRLSAAGPPRQVLANRRLLQMAGVQPFCRTVNTAGADGSGAPAQAAYQWTAATPTTVHRSHLIPNELPTTATRVEAQAPALVHIEPPLTPTDIYLQPHDCLAIAGRSGSGKTSLALALLGLDPSGMPQPAATAKGGVVQAKRPGVLFQQPERYFWGKTIHDELSAVQASGSRIKPASAAQMQAENRALLLSLGLPADYLNRPLVALSDGEQRRAALAIALAAQPDLLIADEPFAGLDLPTVLLVEMMLCQYLSNGGCLVLVTKERRHLYNLARQCIVMHAGRAVFAGDTSALLRQPALMITAGLCAEKTTEACHL